MNCRVMTFETLLAIFELFTIFTFLYLVFWKIVYRMHDGDDGILKKCISRTNLDAFYCFFSTKYS